MHNARIDKQVSEMKLSDSAEIKKLLRFAYSRKFFSSVRSNEISFFPGAQLWNKYLTVSVQEKNCKLSIKVKNHKFLDINKYTEREVSIKWLKGFFDFRAKEAQEDIDEFLRRFRAFKLISKLPRLEIRGRR